MELFLCVRCCLSHDIHVRASEVASGAVKVSIAAENGLILAVLSRILSAEEAATTDFIALGRRVWQYGLGIFLPGGEKARRGRRIRFGAAVRCFVTKWGYCAWNSDNFRGYWEKNCSRNLQMIQPRIQNPVLVLELRFKHPTTPADPLACVPYEG